MPALWRGPTLEPEALLTAVKKIEAEMGRTKTVRWGPRLIDIDILFYGSAIACVGQSRSAA